MRSPAPWCENNTIERDKRSPWGGSYRSDRGSSHDGSYAVVQSTSNAVSIATESEEVERSFDRSPRVPPDSVAPYGVRTLATVRTGRRSGIGFERSVGKLVFVSAGIADDGHAHGCRTVPASHKPFLIAVKLDPPPIPKNRIGRRTVDARSDRAAHRRSASQTSSLACGCQSTRPAGHSVYRSGSIPRLVPFPYMNVRRRLYEAVATVIHLEVYAPAPTRTSNRPTCTSNWCS